MPWLKDRLQRRQKNRQPLKRRRLWKRLSGLLHWNPSFSINLSVGISSEGNCDNGVPTRGGVVYHLKAHFLPSLKKGVEQSLLIVDWTQTEEQVSGKAGVKTLLSF